MKPNNINKLPANVYMKNFKVTVALFTPPQFNEIKTEIYNNKFIK